MSAPTFTISPRPGRGAGASKTRGGAEQDGSETPVKKVDRGTNLPEDDEDDPMDAAGPSRLRPSPLWHAPPLSSTTPHLKKAKLLNTTPSAHLPLPPASPFSRSAAPGLSNDSPHPPKPATTRISDLFPLTRFDEPPALKLEPTDNPPIRKRLLTVGLSGIAVAQVAVKEEEGANGVGGTSAGVEGWATGLLNGKSPSKGKKAFKGL